MRTPNRTAAKGERSEEQLSGKDRLGEQDAQRTQQQRNKEQPQQQQREQIPSSTTMWRSLPSYRLRAISSIARRCLSTTSSPLKPFEKVLIANRGEISQRVMRTCNALGIDTVAIYSTADAHAPFVTMADEAICIGPPASNQSYLNSDKILAAVTQTGAQAVHPGCTYLTYSMNAFGETSF